MGKAPRTRLQLLLEVHLLECADALGDAARCRAGMSRANCCTLVRTRACRQSTSCASSSSRISTAARAPHALPLQTGGPRARLAAPQVDALAQSALQPHPLALPAAPTQRRPLDAEEEPLDEPAAAEVPGGIADGGAAG